MHDAFSAFDLRKCLVGSSLLLFHKPYKGRHLVSNGHWLLCVSGGYVETTLAPALGKTVKGVDWGKPFVRAWTGDSSAARGVPALESVLPRVGTSLVGLAAHRWRVDDPDSPVLVVGDSWLVGMHLQLDSVAVVREKYNALVVERRSFVILSRRVAAYLDTPVAVDLRYYLALSSFGFQPYFVAPSPMPLPRIVRRTTRYPSRCTVTYATETCNMQLAWNEDVLTNPLVLVDSRNNTVVGVLARQR